MRKLLLLAFLIILFSFFIFSEPLKDNRPLIKESGSLWEYYTSTDNAITYIGRWATLDIDNKVTKAAISGDSHFRFKFTGTSIALMFEKASNAPFPEILWSIDGSMYKSEKIRGNLELATDLSDTEHTIEVWVGGIYPWVENRWINRQGVMFQGVVLDTGATLISWPTNSKGNILILGDSIAEGNIISRSDKIPRPNFGNQVAALLEMDLWQYAFAGSGFYGTNNAGVPPTHENYLYILDGVAHEDPKFDIVLIAIGHNDSNDRIDSGSFRNRYAILLDRIKTDNPEAEIFLMRPLNHWVPERYADVQAVALEKNAHFIDTSAWEISPLSSTDLHPNIAGHSTIANYLYPILKPYLSEKASVNNIYQ